MGKFFAVIAAPLSVVFRVFWLHVALVEPLFLVLIFADIISIEILIYRPEVKRQGTSEQSQCGLEHHRDGFHNDVKIPLLHPVEFSLSIPALLLGGTSEIPNVTVDPFLLQHRPGRREERNYEARVE